MKNIIILDGTSAIWKNDLVNYISEKLPESTLIEKISNRRRRNTDRAFDLILTNESDLTKYNFEYRYNFGGYEYGFTKLSIKNALMKYQNVFIVIRNQSIIQKIKADFPTENVFSVFIYSDMRQIEKILTLSSNAELKESISQAFDDYIRNPNIYDLVIINGENPNDFFRTINFVIEKSKEQLKIGNKREIKSRYILNIVFPIIYTILLGLVVNIITNEIFSTWSIVTIVLSSCLTILLVLVHIFLSRTI